MKLAIVGSRDFPDMELVRAFVIQLKPDTTVVSGGARGVDMHAVWQADEQGLATEVFRADWDRHGKSAGFLRNQHIVEAADGLVAFWDGTSKGTKHSIDLAVKKGIWTRVYQSDGSFEQLVG